MKKEEKYIYSIKIRIIWLLIFTPLLFFFTCTIKYGLFEYLNGTKSWQSLGDLNANNTNGFSSLSMSNGVPYLLYTTYSIVPSQCIPIIKKYSNDTWTEVGNLAKDWGNTYIDTNNKGSALSLDVNNGIPYITLKGKSPSCIYLMHYNGTKWATDTSYDFVGATPPYSLSLITFYNGNTLIPELIYEINNTISSYTSYGTTLSSIGNYPSLTTLDNFPCVSFLDSSSNNIVIKKFQNTYWQDLPPINNSGDFMTLRNCNNNLIITYLYNSFIYVKKSDMTIWRDFISNKRTIPSNSKISYDRSITVYNNYLYIAFSDSSKNFKATVYKCPISGGDWEVLGESGFTEESAYNINIQVDNDIPFISYHSGSLNGPLKVMKYDLVVNL